MYPHSHTEFPTRRAVLGSGITLLGGAAIASSGVALANECVLTPSDILGPMYNYGAPMFQKKLATDDEPGERLILTGTVYSSDCRTSLPKTLIEVWQADAKGFYDKKRPGDFIEPPMPFHLRGMLLTDERSSWYAWAGEVWWSHSRQTHPYLGHAIFAGASHDSALLQGRSQQTRRSMGRPQAAACP